MNYEVNNVEDDAWLAKLPLTEHCVSVGQFINLVNLMYGYTHSRPKQVVDDNLIRLAFSNMGWVRFNKTETIIIPCGEKFICKIGGLLSLKKDGQTKLKLYLIEHLRRDTILIEDEKGVEMKPFAITEEQSERYEFSETPLSLLQILGKINRLVDTGVYKKLRSDSIADFLVSEGLLEVVQLSGGRFFRRATKKGNGEGVTYVERETKDGNKYWVNVYDKNGQFYIIDNIQTIVEFNNGTRKLPPASDVADEEKEKRPKYTCRDCMDFRIGNCFGGSNLCEDFRYAHTFSKRETDNWPAVGDATYIRLKGKF